MKFYRGMISCSLLFGFVMDSSGHAVPTHQNITRHAVEYVRTKVTELSCLDDAQLQIGTEHEDDSPKYMFHFNPALNGVVNSHLIENNTRAVTSTCTSSKWGLTDSPSCTEQGGNAGYSSQTETLVNKFTWPVARANAKDSDGNPSDLGWRDLGYVLHLLEDLTSPAHVRNDPHPPYIDGDPIEAVTRDPALPTGDLINFNSPEEYFAALQAWTQSNFFSKDTVFDANLPGPQASALMSDSNYFRDAAGNPIAYKGLRYLFSGVSEATRDRTKATVDENGVLTNQWSRLGPQAVLYAASFINFYYKNNKPLVSIVKNGSFESGDLSSWVPDLSPGYAAAVREKVVDGTYSARIGRWDQPYQQGGCFRCGPVPGAEPSGSDYILQDIDLPDGATDLKLTFAYNVVTYDGADYDWFDMSVLHAASNQVLLRPVNHVGGIIRGSTSNWGLFYTTDWRNVSVNLTPYRGMRLRLLFNVTQDGFGDQIATYVDKVQLTCKF